MTRKKLTVYDYLRCKGKRQLSVLFVHSADEAMAAQEAGIDMIFTSHDAPQYGIYNSFDEKIYFVNSTSSQVLNLIYETEDYISSMTINPNLEMIFSINYKAYNKKWSYDLKCVSLKKE